MGTTGTTSRAVAWYSAIAGAGTAIVLGVELIALQSPEWSDLGPWPSYVATLAAAILLVVATFTYRRMTERLSPAVLAVSLMIVEVLGWNAHWHYSTTSTHIAFPRMLDERTRIDSIVTNGNESIVTITLLELPADIYELGRYISSLRAASVERYCIMPELGPTFESGGGVTMRYRGPSGSEVASFRIGAQECQPSLIDKPPPAPGNQESPNNRGTLRGGSGTAA